MRRLLTLSLFLVAALSITLGQYQVMETQEPVGPAENVMLEQLPASTQLPSTTDPVGTVSSSAVTSIKIGEASNAYTYLLLANNQITSIPGLGTGGVLGFLHRQNIALCAGNNGQYRITVSTDGGATWRVRPTVTVPPEPVNPICWGMGPVNADVGQPTVTDPTVPGRPARYPNFGLFTLSNANSLDSLAGVFTGPILQQAASGWDGYVTGVVTGLNSMPVTTDEQLHWQDDGSGNTTQYFCHTMVQTHPDSNTWYFLSRDFDPNGGTAGDGAAGRQIILNRGVFDNATRQMTWTTAETWSFNFFTLQTATNDVPDGIFPIDPAMAFAPDGQTGYIAFLSDLANQGTDTVIAPILIETKDGGKTWGSPFEIDLNVFPDLTARIQDDTFINTAGDIFWLEPSVTTGFEFDIEVDKNGNPHIFTMICGNKQGNTNAANNDPEPRFGTIYGIYRNHYDITRDSYGDWNMIDVSPQRTLRGYFGDLSLATDASENFSMDAHPQVGRTADGSVIFMTWMDTDTALNPAINGPLDPSGSQTTMTNYAPNLHTFGINVDNMTTTDVVDWTGDDQVWVQKAIGPRLANVVLEDGTDYILPIVVMSVDNNDAIQPVSFHYFSDVIYSETDFSNPVHFFYNCKENPITNNVSVNDAACSMSNGDATAAVSGGIMPYTYEWDDPNGSTTATAAGLAAGVYHVTVTDSFGCTDVKTAIVNNQGAATLAVSGVANPSCFNTVDGTATVTATGGTGTLTYAWSPSGETTATASALPGGTSTVTVTDANGCESREVVMLTTPPEITLTTSGTDVNCAGNGDGTAAVIATGGTGTLTYEWNGDNSLNTANLSNLGPGQYNIVVTDANGCMSNASVNVAEPDPLEVDNFSVTPRPQGWRIEAIVSGGNSPYTYDWVSITDPSYPAQQGQSIFNNPNGCYVVTVTDAKGCVTVDTVMAGVSTCVSGIADEFAAGITTFNVYPNPASQTAFVALSFDRAEEARVELLDVTGKLMRSSVAAGRDMNVRMELDNIAAGVYLVRVSTARGSAVRKLVVR